MSGGGKENRGAPLEFVPCNGFFGSRIGPTRPESPVGWIEDNRIEGAGRANRLRTTDIARADIHAPGKGVQGRVPSCHRRELFLDLDAEDIPEAIAICQYQGQDPASRPQVEQIIPLPQADEVGEQEGIDGKAIPPSLLDDPEAASEDRVDRLVGCIDAILRTWKITIPPRAGHFSTLLLLALLQRRNSR
jgi:hypothetical protein